MYAARLALSAVVLCLLASPVSALDLSAWVPSLRLTPFISQRIEYESNVLQVPVGAQDDVVSRTIPGFLAEYGTEPLSLSAGYRTEILRFLDRGELDTEHHLAVGQVRFELRRLVVTLRDDFTLTTEPQNTELTGRIQTTTNALISEVDYLITERLGVGVNAGWIRASVDQFSQLDRDEYLFGGSAFWRARPKLDLRLTYNYGEKRFEEDANRDVTRHLVMLGLRGEITPKLSSTFRIGFENREPAASDLKGYRGPVLGGDFTYKPAESTKIILAADRSVQESFSANAIFYVTTSATLSVEHEVVRKVVAILRLFAADSEYPSKETIGVRSRFRRDLSLAAVAGVEYNLQHWLRIGVEYSHTRRDSNFREFDFTDDKVSARITAQF